MRMKYELTEQQRAELLEIERQIIALQIRKSQIYAVAPVRYFTETPEEVNAVERIMNEMRIGPLMPKDKIVKLVESEVSGNEYDGE